MVGFHKAGPGLRTGMSLFTPAETIYRNARGGAEAWGIALRTGVSGLYVVGDDYVLIRIHDSGIKRFRGSRRLAD